MGDDFSTDEHFSASLTKATNDFYSGGFHKLTTPLSGTTIAVRRYGSGNETPGFGTNAKIYSIAEIRVYEVGNLLDGATLINSI